MTGITLIVRLLSLRTTSIIFHDWKPPVSVTKLKLGFLSPKPYPNLKKELELTTSLNELYSISQQP